MTVRDAHCSGHHAADRFQWDVLDSTVDRRADVAGFTERRVRSRQAGWRSFVPSLEGYDYAAECAITWRNSAFELIGSGAEQVTTKTFRRGNGATRPGVWATWVVLADVDGNEYLRIVAHLPSSVQNGKRWSGKAARVVAWADAARGLRRLRRRLRRRFKVDEVTISADFNIDLTKRAWRRVVTAAIGNRRSRVLAPDAGTFGRRGIDGYVSTMRGEVEVAGDVAGFDHRPTFVTLRNRKARP